MSYTPESTNNTDLALKIVLFSAITAAFVILVYQLRVLIVCVILAIMIAAAIAPIAEAGERKKIPRLVTVLILCLVVAITYSLLGALLAPAVHEQWNKLNESIPGYLSELSRCYQSALDLAGNQSSALTFSIEDIRNLVLRFLRQTLDMTAGFVGLIVNAVLTLFLAVYFVVKADKIWCAASSWIPMSIRLRITPLILPLASRMGGYVRGQILVAFWVGVFLMAGFSLVGVKYGLILGILAGFLNFVPYIGSLIACAFAVVVALNQTPILAVAVILICGIEQWVESTFMVPILLGKQAFLHPLIVLMAIIIGATLLGIPGAIISVPVTSVAIYLAEEFYLKQFACLDNKASNVEGKSRVAVTNSQPDL